MTDFFFIFGVVLGFALGICFCGANCAEAIAQRVAVHRARKFVSGYSKSMNRSLH